MIKPDKIETHLLNATFFDGGLKMRDTLLRSKHLVEDTNFIGCVCKYLFARKNLTRRHGEESHEWKEQAFERNSRGYITAQERA